MRCVIIIVIHDYRSTTGHVVCIMCYIVIVRRRSVCAMTTSGPPQDAGAVRSRVGVKKKSPRTFKYKYIHRTRTRREIGIDLFLYFFVSTVNSILTAYVIRRTRVRVVTEIILVRVQDVAYGKDGPCDVRCAGGVTNGRRW